MNNKTVTIAIVAILVVAGVGLAALNNKDEQMPAGDKMTMGMNDGKQSAPSSSDMVQATDKVTYKGFAVVQQHIKVKKGTTVTWTNQDSAKHDVTPDNETDTFKASELFGKGETYSVTFNTPGTYSYRCSPHPYMKGIVEVTE